MEAMSTPAYVPRPLPDSFEVEQGHRMEAAFTAGDSAAAERARRHLVAEGSTDAQEAAFLDQYTKALVLVQEMITAQGAGDPARADALARQINATFAPALVRQVHLGMLFAAGRKQGWLPAADHDTLRALTAALGPEITEQFAQIRRGKP
jgi:hypothetical protein